MLISSRKFKDYHRHIETLNNTKIVTFLKSLRINWYLVNWVKNREKWSLRTTMRFQHLSKQLKISTKFAKTMITSKHIFNKRFRELRIALSKYISNYLFTDHIGFSARISNWQRWESCWENGVEFDWVAYGSIA